MADSPSRTPASGSSERASGGVKPLIDKLGVERGMRVAVIGVDYSPLTEAVAQRLAGEGSAEALPDTDMILFQAHAPSDLKRIRELKRHLKKDGALWVLWPKGGASGFGQPEVMLEGLAAGLVDVKVVSVSDLLSGLKFVYRVTDR